MKLNYNTQGSNKLKNLILTISHKSKRKRLSLGIQIDPKDWNQTRNEVRRSHDNHLFLNSQLNEVKNDIYNLYEKLSFNPDFNLESFTNKAKEILPNGKVAKGKVGFWDDFESFKTDYINKPSTLSLIKTLENHLKKFSQAEKLDMEYRLFDHSLIQKYIKYCCDFLELSVSSINTDLKKIRLFLNWGIKREIHNIKVHKSGDFLLEEIKTTKIALTEKELELFESYTPKTKSDKHLLDVFLFACYTAQRIKDIIEINKNDIKDNVWYCTQSKTKKEVVVPLSKKALAILYKYKNYKTLLPKFSRDHMNKRLKKIGEELGVNEITKKVYSKSGLEEVDYVPKYKLITIHSARRTFITISLSKGMNPEIVKKISGHSDLGEFDRYVKFNKDQLTHQMQNFW